MYIFFAYQSIIASPSFGIIVVIWGLVSYAFEKRSRLFTLSLGISSLAAAAYALYGGAWPFMVAELVWAAVALVKWLHA